MPQSTPSPPFPEPQPLTSGWLLTTTSGPAQDLHQRPVPDEPRPEIWIHHVERPALVLGSTQSEALLNVERARADGVEICRRRSGGGIVTLEPATYCWIDVILPAWSPWSEADVGRAFSWLGATWADALARSVPLLDHSEALTVHQGPLEGGPPGRLICFASLGPGEITVDGRKVVGLSQRRTKRAARFQTVAQGPWTPDLLHRYLDRGAAESAGLDWDRLNIGLDAGRWPGSSVLADAFLDALPRPDSRS